MRTYPPYGGFGFALLCIDIVVKAELLTSGRFYEFTYHLTDVATNTLSCFLYSSGN